MSTTTTTSTTFRAEHTDGRAILIENQQHVEYAAEAAAKHFYPRNRNLSVMRTTGSTGLSGWFQAYVPIGNDAGLTSYGQPFHVGRAR